MISRDCALRRRRFSRSAAARRSSRDLSGLPIALQWVVKSEGASRLTSHRADRHRRRLSRTVLP